MKRCDDCGKELKEGEKNKTWREFFEGFPACIECDDKLLEKIDKNMKIIKNASIY